MLHLFTAIFHPQNQDTKAIKTIRNADIHIGASLYIFHEYLFFAAENARWYQYNHPPLLMEKSNSLSQCHRQNTDPISTLRKSDSEYYIQELCTQRLLDNDSFTGWQTPITQPKFIATKKRKTKRQDITAANDGRGWISYSDGIWNASVEKYSYRYIPSNGCYKTMKLQLNQPKSNFSHRKHSPLATSSISSDHKQLQRDIKRDLRREFKNLLDTNRPYFRLTNSPSAVNDCLEDEQDFRDKYGIGKNTHSPPPAPPASTLPENHLHFPLPENSRILETQSAQPAMFQRLEDLVINKRCTTNLEKLTSEPEINLVPPDKSWVKSDKSYISRRMHYASPNQVEALAKKTFNGRKEVPIETQYKHVGNKHLGPIEKVTPSLRTMYDNSKALQEMMKLSCSIQPTYPTSDGDISSVMSIKRQLNVEQLQGISNQKKSGNVRNAAFVTTGGTSVTSKYKVARLNEAQQGTSRIRDMVDIAAEGQASTNFQAYLPSICGKRITTKLGSLR